VRVTEQLHDLNLAKDLLEIVDIQLGLVNDLDRHLQQQPVNQRRNVTRQQRTRYYWVAAR